MPKLISLLAILNLAAVTACSVHRHPAAYPYSYPVASSKGCNSIIGIYTFSINPDMQRGQKEREIIENLFMAAGQPPKKWQAFLSRAKSFIQVRVSITGQPGENLFVSLQGADEEIIDTIHLDAGLGQFTCRSGSLHFPNVNYSGVQHEVGSTHSHWEFSLSAATDGALIGHFYSSSRGWAWFIPYYENHEDWVVVPPSTRPANKKANP